MGHDKMFLHDVVLRLFGHTAGVIARDDVTAETIGEKR
jgi:hypothetical protein